MRRFRPNFFVETDAGLKGLIDAEWGGRTLRIGEVELLCEIPCERCAMTIQAQSDLPKDESIFRTIVKEANTNLGSLCERFEAWGSSNGRCRRAYLAADLRGLTQICVNLRLNFFLREVGGSSIRRRRRGRVCRRKEPRSLR